MAAFRLFLISLTLTACTLLAVMYVNRPKETDAPQLTQIADNLFVTSQLKPENIRLLRKRGFRSIVDIRPDGEAKDQPSSAEIEDASKIYGVEFHYIPVPHENIPGTAVNVLHDVLSRQPGRTVLYCRSGRRAVRTYALVEASRAGGPSADAILKMASAAGFSAADLKDEIAQRIAHRNNVPEVKN